MALETTTGFGDDVTQTTCFALVSYSDSDKDWVFNHLVPNVERNNEKVVLFLRDRDFEPGVSKLDAYAEIARNCDKIVVVLSRSYVKNGACMWELDQALSSGNTLVPIVLCDCEVPQTLRTFNPLMYRKDDGDFWERVRDTITDKTKDLSFSRGRTTTFPKLPGVLMPRTTDVRAVLGLLRESQALLPSTMSERQRGQTVVGVWGMAGSGKTVLAAMVAEALVHEESRQVFWIEAGKQNSVLQNLTDLFADMTNSCLSFTDLSDVISVPRHHSRDQDYVIVLDDVRSVDDASDVIDAMSGTCQVLVTSRDAQVFRALQVSHVHNLKTFDKRESEALLLKKIGLSYALDPFDERRVMVDVMLQTCGGLPLAISVVGATIGNPEDVSNWRSTARALKDHSPKDGGETRYNNIFKSLDVSLNALTPNLQRRFLLCGIFPDNVDIPKDTLTLLWRTEDQNLSDILSQRDADSLFQRSLLLEGGKHSSYRLHEITRDFARRRLGAEEPSAHRNLIEAYRTKFGDVWEDFPNDGYYFHHISHHFKQAGMTDELMKLFLSYSWLKAKLEHTDFFALLSDFQGIELSDSVVQVRDALSLSGPVLAADKSQLGAQLIGRLTNNNNEEIAKLLEEVEEKSHVALHPSRQCLTAPGGPAIQTYNRHGNTVLCIAATNATGAKRVFMGSADFTIRVWDLESCKDVGVLRGHHSDVSSLALRKDDVLLASGSWDSTVKVWDVERLTLLCTLEGHKGKVHGVTFPQDGVTIASVSSDQTVKVWKLDATPASNELLPLTPITSIIWPQTKDFEIETVGRTQLSLTSPTESGDVRGEAGSNTWLCVSTLVGHTGEVNGICAFHRSNSVATCSNDHTVRLWDLDSLQSVCLEGHEKAVYSVAMTTDDKFLASASGDRKVGVWDVERRDLLHKLGGHTDMVAAITIAADDSTVVSGGGMDDTTIRIWNLVEGEQVCTFRGHGEGIKALAIVAADSGRRRLLSGSLDGSCRIWNLEENLQDVEPLPGHDSPVYALAMATKGRLVASGSRSGELKLWNFHSGETEAVVRNAHSRSIRALAVSEDESMVVSGSKDKKVKIWDVSQDAETPSDIFRSVQPSYLFERWVLRGHVGAVQTVAISQDSRLVLSGGWDNLVFLWNAKKGRCVRKLVHVSYGIMSVVFCKQSVVACARDNVICRWDGLTVLADDQTKRTVVRGPSARWLSYPAVVHPREEKIVSGFPDDERYRVWDKAGRQFGGNCGHPSGSVITALTVSHDGKTLISASTAGTITALHLSGKHDVTHYVTQKEVIARSELTKQTSAITILETGTEGNAVFLTGDVQGAVKMWHTAKDADAVRYVRDRFEVLGAALGQITSFCNLSKHLVVSGSGGGTLAVWDVRERRRRDCWEAHDAVVTDIVTTDGGGRQTILSVPNTRLVLSASLDRTIKLWFVSASSYQPLHLMFLPRDCPPVLCLAAAPDGRHFVTGSADNKLRAYDANTFELIKEYPSDYYGVNRVGFTASGREIMCCYSGSFLGTWDFNSGECLSGKRDNSKRRSGTWCHFSAVVPNPARPLVVTGANHNKVTVWDYTTGEISQHLQVPNRKLRHDRCSQEVTCVAVTSDGERIVAGSEDKSLWVWSIVSMDDAEPLCQFTFEHAPRAVAITDTGKICVGLSNGQVCFLQLKEQTRK